MANDVITGGAVVGGIIAVLFALRPYLLHRKKEPSEHPNGRAGFQDSAFWEKRFDKLETAIATVDRISREHRSLSRGEVESLRDLLVDIDTNLKVALAVNKTRA